MYHQPRLTVNRKSTRPKRILHVVGHDELRGCNVVHPARFRSWKEVSWLGERAYIIRIDEDLHVIYSDKYRTWGRA